MKVFTVIMLVAAVALSGAALAVSLMHAGPQGPRGTQGAAGAQGPAGEQGPAGQDAPALSYQCQMLFPMGSSSGTETTMYWPCTNKAGG